MEMSFYEAVMLAQDVMATRGWLVESIAWAGEVPQPGGEQTFEVAARHGGDKFFIRTQDEWERLRAEHALERKKK